jgi:hypothetical protein
MRLSKLGSQEVSQAGLGKLYEEPPNEFIIIQK